MKAMTPKEIIDDLLIEVSIKNLRHNLKDLIFEFLTNDNIDDRQEAYMTYIIIDCMLKRIRKYQKGLKL
jgi:hypothetical protein